MIEAFIAGGSMPSDKKSKLVEDAMSAYLDKEIDKRIADPSLPPIYSYPMNGLRPLEDKPLVRPQAEEKSS